jgi:hypothetical protein
MIIEKIYRWRQYYTGFRDKKTGKWTKLKLDQAAVKVGIPKKSCDDYLL